MSSEKSTIFNENGELPLQEFSSDQIDEEYKKKSRWTSLLIICSLTTCFGSAVPAGFNIGVMNIPRDIMKQFCNESVYERYGTDVHKDQLDVIWSVIVSIFLIGGVSGSFASSWIADKYGRRMAMAIGNIFGILGAIIFLLVPISNSIELFILGRILVGFSGGIATSLVSMYMMEIAPLELRGAVGTFCQLGIATGVFIGQLVGLKSILGTENHWHIMLSSFAPLCILGLVVLFYLPESPKYLYLIKSQKEESIKELLRLRNIPREYLHKEIRILEEESILQSSSVTWSISRVLKDRSVRLPLLLVASLQGGQQLSGINAVFFYSDFIFEKANLDKDERNYATLGTGLINILMAVVCLRIMTLYGRRIMFLISAYGSAFCLLCIMIGLTTITYGSFSIWLCVVSVLLYVLVYGLGVGPIPYFIASELFDVASRPAGMAIGSICNWGGNFVVGLLFPTVMTILGPYTFLIFVLFILLVAVFNSFYLPETKGVDISEITAQLKRKPLRCL